MALDPLYLVTPNGIPVPPFQEVKSQPYILAQTLDAPGAFASGDYTGFAAHFGNKILVGDALPSNAIDSLALPYAGIVIAANINERDVQTRYVNFNSKYTPSDGFAVGMLNGAECYIRNYENIPLKFYVNDIEQMRMLAGWVGIGAVAAYAAERFSVNGDTYLNGELLGTGEISTDGVFRINSASADRAIEFTNSDIRIAGNIGNAGRLDLHSNQVIRVLISGVPVSDTTVRGLEIFSGKPEGLVLGANLNSLIQTNNTTKYAQFGGKHYTNSEEPATISAMVSNGSTNTLHLGGGMPAQNAATRIKFHTAANNTTLVGTEAMNIDNAQKVNVAKAVVLPLDAAQAYLAGQHSYDPVSKTHLFDTGFPGVRVNAGQEVHVPFFNDTGVQISNGKTINAQGVDATFKVLKGILADSSSPATSSAVIGQATHDVPDQTVGLATLIGQVRDYDTSLLATSGIHYLGTNGDGTNSRPKHPSVILILGSIVESHATEGIAHVQVTRFRRRAANRSYGFTSQGIGAGTFYKAGFYAWEDTDANLTQASASVNLGISGKAYAAHVGIVPSGSGIVDTGQVGLQVTGTLDSETGPQVAAQTVVITEDITTLTANLLVETLEKFSGQVVIAFYVASGAPTAYSLDFNYGYSKYEDFNNRNVTVVGAECIWQGNAADSAMDVALKHHKAAGWTYAATGFTPGNGDIIRRSVAQAIDGDVVSGADGSWKRSEMTTFIEGNAREGVIFEVTTGQPSTIQNMDMHIIAVSEELSS